MTSAQVLTTAGLALDLVGGVLLAVEAIRLRNLEILRDEVLPEVRLFFETPLIYLGDGAEDDLTPEEIRRNQRRGFGGRLPLYVAFHFAAVVAFLMLIDLLRLLLGVGPDVLAVVALASWGSGWRWAVAVGLLGCWTLLAFSLGCAIHRAIENAVSAFVRLLIAIEKGTPSGATGITGALLFVAGFVLQLVGVWI